MIALTLPPTEPGTWLGVILDRHEIAGTPMWRVQTRGRAGDAAERSWFASRDAALTFAVDRADRRHLPLFDLCGGEVE